MAAPRELVLASTSRYRRDLLARIGLPFRTRTPACDEEALKRAMPADVDPTTLAVALARAKAESVRDEEAGAVILGSDQVVAFDGKILGKPGSKEAARDQLRALAGATHALVTAIALAHGGKIIEHVDLTKLTMRSLTSEQIARYVDADDPIDCAGSYKLEARGITLFTAIDSADHTAIVGLPLIAVTSMLGWLGFPVP